MIADMILGFMLGALLWYMLFKPLREMNNLKHEQEPCIQHRWVMSKISKDLVCSECGKTVEELKWSDKDL